MQRSSEPTLQEEIEMVNRRHTSVHHSSWQWIFFRRVGVGFRCRVKPSVVSFSLSRYSIKRISQTSSTYTYDNGQLGLVTLLRLVKCLKRSLEFWKLLLHHQPILAL
jgi:hypothetical protein